MFFQVTVACRTISGSTSLSPVQAVNSNNSPSHAYLCKACGGYKYLFMQITQKFTAKIEIICGLSCELKRKKRRCSIRCKKLYVPL